MRKIFLFMMVSADGFFEGEGHTLFWHNVDEEFEEFAHAQNSSLDTSLMGHRTYDLMASVWPTEEGEKMDKETADWFTRARKVVVAQPFVPTWSGTEVISTDVIDSVRKLKEEPGTEIALLGSNMLAVSLMEAGLIDEFRLMYNPVAIGKGTRLFAGLQKPMKFDLLSSRTFRSGNVLICYGKNP